MRGAVYIAFGEPARTEARLSIETLLQFNPGLSIAVISNEPLPLKGIVHVIDPQQDAGGRWQKVQLDGLSPFCHTLYLDADTRIRADLSAGFRMLEDGWELVITPSEHQGGTWLWHVGAEDRAAVLEEWPCKPLQLQGGMFFFRKCDAIRRLFEAWQDEWLRFRDQDQGALLRALAKTPVRVWILGRPWNGGSLVDHRFGRAKRR